MNTSWLGTKFICAREALVTCAYHDGGTDAEPRYSIGFGSQDPPVKPGDTISIDDAFIRIQKHIAKNDLIIGKAIKVPIRQNEWDAVSSLFYQGGSRPLSAVAALFDKGPTIWAIREFINWGHGANNLPTEGHTRRRIREMMVALDSDYGDLNTYKLFDGDPHVVPVQLREFPNEPQPIL